MLLQGDSSPSDGGTETLVAESTLVNAPMDPNAVRTPLSSVFSPQVLYWKELIETWAASYQVDPNLIATIIQIESCGHPTISSYAGAQGLFQVMPLHFQAGEDPLDIQTNARRGLDHLVFSLRSYNGHVGMALAAYNRGVNGAAQGWGEWPTQTRDYYRWGTGIYSEAISGAETSPTLEAWLQADRENHRDGLSLCDQAAVAQEQLQKNAQAGSGAISG